MFTSVSKECATSNFRVESLLLFNELVVRQLPGSKNVSTEAEDIVGIRSQAMNAEVYNSLRLSMWYSEKQCV
jgi:hypothetical protein